MSSKSDLKESVRAGAFSSLSAADEAVQRLLDAGFTPKEITVVSSDEARERYFREFEHQEPAGEHAGTGTAAGASIGAVAGGLTAIAVGAASGAIPLIIAGAAGISAGSAMGGFVGAMLTRANEKEVSNFYDQAVREGQVVVAVEVHGASAPARLAEAAAILDAAGTKPVRLPEG